MNYPAAVKSYETADKAVYPGWQHGTPCLSFGVGKSNFS